MQPIGQVPHPFVKLGRVDVARNRAPNCPQRREVQLKWRVQKPRSYIAARPVAITIGVISTAP